MDISIIQAIILGKIEGITEFLPISSTFHMLIAEQIMGIPQTEFVKLFTVFIQAGAILSVFLLYFNDLWKDKTLILKTGAAFVPTAIIGFLLYHFIKEVLFASPMISVAVFIIVGILFIVMEKMIKKESLQLTKAVSDLTYKEAVIIGCAQAIAVIPGVSRSGSVMVAMMGMKFTRADAARFSFILSIPTIFAAAALDALETKDVLLHNQANITILLIGFLVAFIVSFIIVKWFIFYLQKHTLELFGWYRIILGLVLLFYYLK